MNFNQIDACAKLVQTLARLELPGEYDPKNECDADQDAILCAIDDAGKLYVLIEEARDILRHSRTKTTLDL
jgi:hypothetical protein